MNRKRRYGLIASLAVLAVIVLLIAVPMAGRASEEEMLDSVQSIEETVMQRALQCYVIEGAYPMSLEYLEENYGLQINRDDYLVVYTPFAENLPPEVKVLYRDGKKE